MECRLYKDEDFEAIKSWYKARGLDAKQEYLSKRGFIVPGIAAGFLVATDTAYCIFEPFIGNPEVTPDERDAALHMVINKLLDLAKELGYKAVYGFSSSNPMIIRSLMNGFKITEHCVAIGKSL